MNSYAKGVSVIRKPAIGGGANNDRADPIDAIKKNSWARRCLCDKTTRTNENHE